MKSLRFMLPVVLISIATVGFAQTDTQKKDAPKSDAQKSFEQLKTLAGSWEGRVTTDPKEAFKGDDHMKVTLRVTSRGNALMHEMTGNSPDDPISMVYLDNDRLLLTHFCDAGNRPRMVAKASPDGKTIEFDFLDVAGNTQYGNMYHAKFTLIDADHHTEDWTFHMKDKMVTGHVDLQRVKPQEARVR
jgi:hypothetical protein